MPRPAQIYLSIVGLALIGLGLILYLGGPNRPSQLTPRLADKTVEAREFEHVSLVLSVEERLFENAADPLGRFFLQLVVIIVVANGVGLLFKWIGQPVVVGEMMAGVLLGPSLFGLLAPHLFSFVFAPASLEPLRLLSQVGVCLFMCTVGMEMDWGELRAKAYTAIVISHASIALPALFGAALAWVFYNHLAQPGAPFAAFALFVAISTSITAFPVLVRILQDRKMLRTPLGRIVAACAAVGDVTAWTLVALIVAFARSADFGSAAVCLGFVLFFVTAMFWGSPAKPARDGLETRYSPAPNRLKAPWRS
jgi:Kef-type K+ transport system membrane component KefB